MAVAENLPPAARPPTSAELRRLWEQGDRARAIHGVLQEWERLMRGADDLRWLEQALRRCGLSAEAMAVQARQARHAEAGGADWESLIRSVLHSGDPWWARELLRKAGTPSRGLQALNVEAELALGDPTAAIADWVSRYQDQAALESAVDWWVRAGRVEEAEQILAQADGLDIWRARFALWRKEPQVARTFLAKVPPAPAVTCLEAIAATLEGRLDVAESSLRTLVNSDVAPEAYSWLATVLRKQRRYAEAIRAADAAALASPSFNVATRLERDLADACERATRRSWKPWGSRLPRIATMELASVLYALGLKPSDRMGKLAGVLERFAGNRTPHLTVLEHGKLRSCRFPTDPRSLGASAQRVLWTRGFDATRALYRELSPRVDHHPLFRIYHGEIELWMGEYAEAEGIFREILDRDRAVRWAWIGLGASVMFQGDLQEAQRIWERGLAIVAPGPTLYVYRGECYRRQGEAALARRELETALQQKPQRLSARINLALLDGDGAALQQAERDCTALAPLLMDELQGSREERLEQVLTAMRGNRSSSEWHATYHLWGHLWHRGVA